MEVPAQVHRMSAVAQSTTAVGAGQGDGGDHNNPKKSTKDGDGDGSEDFFSWLWKNGPRGITLGVAVAVGFQTCITAVQFVTKGYFSMLLNEHKIREGLLALRIDTALLKDKAKDTKDSFEKVDTEFKKVHTEFEKVHTELKEMRVEFHTELKEMRVEFKQEFKQMREELIRRRKFLGIL
jgi:hypothetical protein